MCDVNCVRAVAIRQVDYQAQQFTSTKPQLLLCCCWPHGQGNLAPVVPQLVVLYAVLSNAPAKHRPSRTRVKDGCLCPHTCISLYRPVFVVLYIPLTIQQPQAAPTQKLCLLTLQAPKVTLKCSTQISSATFMRNMNTHSVKAHSFFKSAFSDVSVSHLYCQAV
jgi:hypothetical protein